MVREKVVIIIPTYNEALNIKEVITEVFEIAKLICDKEINILIFDSNSTDATRALASGLQVIYEKLHLISEPLKSGLG